MFSDLMMVGVLCLLFFTIFAIEARDEFPFRSSDRILGGFDAPEGFAPHQVSVQAIRGVAHCGGSILNEMIVLSAAHCTEHLNFGSVVEYATVQIGYGRVVGIRSFINHQDYIMEMAPNKDVIYVQHDIALIVVQEFMVLDGSARAIGLNRVPISAGVRGTVTGFGMMSPQSPPSHRLQMAYVYTDLQCPQHNWHHFICLSSTTSSICQGDSGGPLVINEQLAGVASFGLCQASGQFGYTDVHRYIGWIEQQIQIIYSL